MNALAGLEANQREVLAHLREPDGEHARVLTALLTTSCMLELSKLGAARLDLPTYVNALVEVLSQFAPIERAVIRVEPGDLPPLRASSGTLDVDEDDLLMAAALAGDAVVSETLRGAPLTVDGAPVGYLAAAGVPEPLADARLVEQAAELLGSSLATQFEAERLRRRAALARVMELVASLDEGYGEPALTELGTAMAALPNTVGSTLQVEDLRLAGPVELVSGVVESPFELSRSFEAGRVRASFALRLAVVPTADDEARADEVVAAFLAAFARIERSRRLQEEVETDALTGIGNRRRASRALAQAAHWAERKHGQIAVLMIDLDHFKRVNDSFGHPVGDDVLRSVARAVAGTVRGYDTAARWGGEELLVICPDTDVAGAQALARRIREQVPLACEGILPLDWRQTCSVGVAVSPEHADGVQALLAAADKALYAAKSAGRDRVAVAAAARAPVDPSAARPAANRRRP